MISDEKSGSDLMASDVSTLCNTYLVKDQKRIELDQRLITLPADDQKHDALWDELEAVSTQLSAVVAKLAITPAQAPPDLRAKAIVLARLLRIPAIARGIEAAALALSVADEIARLI